MSVLQRLAQLFARQPADPATAALYRACVTQARAEGFYLQAGVPDTVDGRFDMLLLCVYLLMRRLGTENEAKQNLFDLMFADMDRSLREMGVGDMGVGRRMKLMISSFYGRAETYEKALAEGDAALADAFTRNLYGKTTATLEQVQRMVRYTRAAITALDQQNLADILAGQVVFPAPESV